MPMLLSVEATRKYARVLLRDLNAPALTGNQGFSGLKISFELAPNSRFFSKIGGSAFGSVRVQLESREILAHFSETGLQVTVLGLSSLVSEHRFDHTVTMTTVSAGICDVKGFAAGETENGERESVRE